MSPQGRDVALRAAVAALAAPALETGARSLAAVPFAFRLSSMATDTAYAGLAALPALAFALLGGRLSCRVARLLAGMPVALMLADLAFCDPRLQVRQVAVIAAVGGIAGMLAVRLLSPRQLGLAALVGAATALGVWFRPTIPAPTAEPSVLLIVLDTTAASHLPTWGYGRPTAPALAVLAARARVYRRAVSPAPWTLPSHAAIFAGRLPSELGFDGTSFEAPPDVGSIADDMQGAGRPAYGISGNPGIAEVGMLRAGFREFWSEQRLVHAAIWRLWQMVSGGTNFQSRGDHVTALALDWVDRIAPPGRPWFLFLNYLDPHAPYDPPRRERQEFAADVNTPVVANTELYNSGRIPLTAAVRAAIPPLYDGEIAAMDHAVDRLLTGLAARGFEPGRNLLVVVTADHGEMLGEDGLLGHLLGMPDQVLHVPLLINGPGIPAEQVATTVQTHQLRATLRALLALPPLPGIAPALPPWGDALPLIVSEHPAPKWYFEELHDSNPSGDLRALLGDRLDSWIAVERDGKKVLFDDAGHGAAYDLIADPGERQPRPLAEGAALVTAYVSWRKTIPTPRPGGLDEETRRALESIGYVSHGAGPNR